MAEVRCRPISPLEQQKVCKMASVPLRSFEMCHLRQLPQRASTPLEGSRQFVRHCAAQFSAFNPLDLLFLSQRRTVLKPSRLQGLDSHLQDSEENRILSMQL